MSNILQVVVSARLNGILLIFLQLNHKHLYARFLKLKLSKSERYFSNTVSQFTAVRLKIDYVHTTIKNTL